MQEAWKYTAQSEGTPGGASEGNRISLFSTGDEVLTAAMESIAGARERVWLEMYIFEPDPIGLLIIEALSDAARRGCEVLLLFDRLGSTWVQRKHLKSLREAGGRVSSYNPIFSWQRLRRKAGSLLHRDHRKILITDSIGFCGGFNVSGEYLGPGIKRFYDMMLRLEGPGVQDLATVFADSYQMATGELLELPERSPPCGDAYVQVLELNRRKRQDDLDIALYGALSNAERTCYLTTPYFIPARWFTNLLLDAARRGVDVRVLTAGKSDVPAARLAGSHLYGSLMESGVRIYEMKQPTLHAKSLTIDGCYSIVGSYNVDRYGSKHNLEVGVAALDTNLARRLEAEFFFNLDRSHKVQIAEWKRRSYVMRIGARIIYLLSGI